ncbi:hypothetical protein C0J52_27769, partial [Blattella germanica]
ELSKSTALESLSLQCHLATNNNVLVYEHGLNFPYSTVLPEEQICKQDCLLEQMGFNWIAVVTPARFNSHLQRYYVFLFQVCTEQPKPVINFVTIFLLLQIVPCESTSCTTHTLTPTEIHLFVVSVIGDYGRVLSGVKVVVVSRKTEGDRESGLHWSVEGIPRRIGGRK